MGQATAISLFSGLGGIDIGLHRAGVETLVCIEKDPDAAETLRRNSAAHPDATPPIGGDPSRYPWRVLEEDVHDLSADEILAAADAELGEVDLVVGGPPCQTFSRSNEGSRQGTNADRGMLFEQFARVLKGVQPKAFLFENVRGLASTNEQEDLDIIKDELRAAGYTVNEEVMNAADFGVPQTRSRLFILALRDEKPYFPEPTHVDAANTLTGKPCWVSAGDALANFDIDAQFEDSGYMNAVGGQYGYLLTDIPPGGNYQHFSERKYIPEQREYVARDEDELDEKVFDWRSRHWNYLLKQDPERPTWTLQASPGTYVGPFHWRSRRYSFIEEMQLMDLPRTYYIAGGPREIQRQIGNAVPPGLAEALISALLGQAGIVAGVEPTVEDFAARPDGGESSAIEHQSELEVDASRSPWEYAAAVKTSLSDGEVTIYGEGKRIAQMLDVLQILRHQTAEEIDPTFSEAVVDSSNSKNEKRSQLIATIG